MNSLKPLSVIWSAVMRLPVLNWPRAPMPDEIPSSIPPSKLFDPMTFPGRTRVTIPMLSLARPCVKHSPDWSEVSVDVEVVHERRASVGSHAIRFSIYGSNAAEGSDGVETRPLRDGDKTSVTAATDKQEVSSFWGFHRVLHPSLVCPFSKSPAFTKRASMACAVELLDHPKCVHISRTVGPMRTVRV